MLFSLPSLLSELQPTLLSLQLSATPLCHARWLLLQRQHFDVVVHGEPYHAIQVVVDLQHGRYYARVFGRTHARGRLDDAAQLRNVCQDTFYRVLPCMGHPAGPATVVDATQTGWPDRLISDTPVRRVVSTQCQRVCRWKEEEEQEETVVTADPPTARRQLCTSCRELDGLPAFLRVKDEPEPFPPDDLHDVRLDRTAEENDLMDDTVESDANGEDPLSTADDFLPDLKDEDIDMDAAEYVEVVENENDGKYEDEDDEDEEWNEASVVKAQPKKKAKAKKPAKKSGDGSAEKEKKKKQTKKKPAEKVDGGNDKKLFYRNRMTPDFQFLVVRDSASGVGVGKQSEKFGCTLCDKAIKKRICMWVHMHRKHDLDLYACKYCPGKFNFPSETVSHVEREHGHVEERTVDCPVCKEACAMKDRNFVSHVQACIKKERLPNDPVRTPHTEQCDVCLLQCKNRDTLLQHKKIHTGERQPELMCSECDYRTFTTTSLIYHQRNHLREKGLTQDERGNPLYFTCEFCGIMLRSKYYLREHIRTKHDDGGESNGRQGGQNGQQGGGQQERHQCEQCGQVCTSKNKWYQHRIQAHTERFKCDECGVCFRGSYPLKQHNDLYHGEPGVTYDCEMCGKKMKTAEYLSSHKRRVHGGKKPEQVKCPLCPAVLPTVAAMRAHRDKTHPKKPKAT